MKKLLFGLLLSALSAGVVHAQPGPSEMRRAFDVIDTDGDAFISLDEFHKDVLRGWHALDVDRSGYLTKETVEQIPDHGQGMWRALSHLDKDKDGKISFREVVEARMSYFDTADLDGDERLSVSETLAYQRKVALERAQRRAARQTKQ